VKSSALAMVWSYISFHLKFVDIDIDVPIIIIIILRSSA
jgi:hypothetical protein